MTGFDGYDQWKTASLSNEAEKLGQAAALAQWLDTLLVPGDPDRPKQAAAKLRELEEHRERLCHDIEKQNGDLDEMQSESDKLRAALERYANPDFYEREGDLYSKEARDALRR